MEIRDIYSPITVHFTKYRFTISLDYDEYHASEGKSIKELEPHILQNKSHISFTELGDLTHVLSTMCTDYKIKDDKFMCNLKSKWIQYDKKCTKQFKCEHSIIPKLPFTEYERKYLCSPLLEQIHELEGVSIYEILIGENRTQTFTTELEHKLNISYPMIDQYSFVLYNDWNTYKYGKNRKVKSWKYEFITWLFSKLNLLQFIDIDSNNIKIISNYYDIENRPEIVINQTEIFYYIKSECNHHHDFITDIYFPFKQILFDGEIKLLEWITDNFPNSLLLSQLLPMNFINYKESYDEQLQFYCTDIKTDKDEEQCYTCYKKGHFFNIDTAELCQYCKDAINKLKQVNKILTQEKQDKTIQIIQKTFLSLLNNNMFMVRYQEDTKEVIKELKKYFKISE